MKLIVDFTRHGATSLDWINRIVLFRKPATLDVRKKPATYEFVQAKGDGRRVLVVGAEDSQHPHVFTTTGADISEKVEGCDWYQRLCSRLAFLHWIDGELVVEGAGREELTTALADHDPQVRLQGFGVSHCPASAALEEVDRVLEDLKIPSLTWARCKRPSEVLLETHVQDAMAALDNVKKLGVHYDGVVFKNGMYSEWAKHKHMRTIDLVVTGFEPGKGKYTGQCGSLKCAVITEAGYVSVANVSGMDDETRATISDCDKHRVVEVEYERVGAGGRLQHPRFLRWRDDKPAVDCHPDQDPRLVEILSK